MEVRVIVKKYILFFVSILCMTLPQSVLAKGDVTVGKGVKPTLLTTLEVYDIR